MPTRSVYFYLSGLYFLACGIPPETPPALRSKSISSLTIGQDSGLGTAQRFIHSALTAVRWCLWGSPRTQRALYTLLFDTTVGFLVYCIPLVRAVQHSCWSRALLGSYPRSVVVVLLLVVHEASCGASLHVRVQAKL